MTLRPQDINRLAPVLWGVAGAMFFLAAWLDESIAFAGVGAMFIVFGLAAFVRDRTGRAR